MEKQFFTIKLWNANISDIRMEMLNNMYPENVRQNEREQISFTYQKIEWTYEDGAFACQDDWEARV